MRLLIDANILLDVLQDRKPHADESSLIWKLCETKQAEGIVTALSLANLIYVMRKELDPEKTELVLKQLELIFHYEDLTAANLRNAAAKKWDDFEDAVQSIVAERIHADYIITRNVRDYYKSDIMALTPAEFFTRQ